MFGRRQTLLLGVGLSMVAGPVWGQEHVHGPAGTDPGAPLYNNLGDHHYQVATLSAEAQAYFDQGLRLYWAFNHPEAERAFREAERRDSACAMCLFGQALALGPNINIPMDPAVGPVAAGLARRGLALAQDERERAMLQALTRRYDSTLSRAAADSAWARAIGAVADRYAGDTELQVLYAEALMDLSPWHYWTSTGEPRPDTPLILGRIEQALQADPDHPGGCHLLIHAVEAREPARAVHCAERLAAIMPGAGHLVHMPGHIYLRVGRYADAIRANEHAVHADLHYFEGSATSRRDVYGLSYYPHNWHFLSFAATLAGQQQVALRAARKVIETVSNDVARQYPVLEAVTPVVYCTLVSFGRWDAVLAEPLPPPDLRYTTGMAYYARGMAFAARGRWAEARAALDSVGRVARQLPEGDSRLALRIAATSLAGEIQLRSGRPAAAVASFRQAVVLEDSLGYMEPPVWYYPVRQSLGKALLAAGQPAQAETVYREDLERFPENGWSLYGLMQSLERQGRTAERDDVAARFASAWKDADVRLVASRF